MGKRLSGLIIEFQVYSSRTRGLFPRCFVFLDVIANDLQASLRLNTKWAGLKEDKSDH